MILSKIESLMNTLRYLFLLGLTALPTQAIETTLTDSEGKPAYLYTPAKAPEAGKTYWLAIGVHGAGGDGKGAAGIADWAKDDVIVLGPSFSELEAKPDDVAKTDKPAGMPPARLTTPAWWLGL